MSLPLEVQHTFKPTRILPASPIRNIYCPDHLARACPVHLLRRSLVIFIVISYCTDYQKETLDNSRCPSPVKKVLLESSLPPDSCLQQTCVSNRFLFGWAPSQDAALTFLSIKRYHSWFLSFTTFSEREV